MGLFDLVFGCAHRHCGFPITLRGELGRRTEAASVTGMDNVPYENRGAALWLEPIAMVALKAGRMLMEAGASARNVEEIVQMVAHGLGAECVDLRAGYTSLAVTIGVYDSGITRMRKVGDLGVNQRLN